MRTILKLQRCFSLSRIHFRHFANTASSFLSPDNVVRSPLTPVAVPDLTIYEFLLEKCDKWYNQTAVICAETGRSLTFKQYEKNSKKVALGLLAKLGFKKGDCLAVLLPNVPEYVTTYLATLQSGILITPINPGYTSYEVARQMKDCSAKGIVTLAQTFNIASEAVKLLQTNKNIPIITVKHQQSDTTPRGAINFQELCEYNGPEVKIERPNPDDIAFIPYSSGTSGLPKGVLLTHRNIVSDVIQLQHESLSFCQETSSLHQDVTPMIAPLYHCYGKIPILFNVFSKGAKCVFLPKYNPNNLLDLLEKYPPSFIYLVPPLVIMLNNYDKATKHHMRKVNVINSAAAPLAGSDIHKFKDKFGNHIKVVQCYGLTETGPVTHAQRTDKEMTPGSVGCNLSLVESKIVSVDDETKNLGPNESGHLLIRGPNVMPGYFNNPKATEECIDKEKWFKSGDIAHYNEEGEFFITDRIKELIKVKGFQVAPAELEALIREHPNVDDVAVIGVTHQSFGEVPRAFVVPRKNSNLKTETVIKHVETKAAKHKHLLGGVVFTESIPKNPSGKILRRLLKD